MKNYKVMLLVLIISLILRSTLINQSFWLDEASQAQQSSLSLSQIWFDRGGDFHPPLFYILSHLWLQVNKSEIWLRTLPILAGVLNVYVLYLFAQKLFPNLEFKITRYSIPLSVVAALLLASSPFHIYYSQEFRSYSLLCLLATLSMYLLHEKRYLWLSVVNALMLYTHYSSVFLILTQFILSPLTIIYFPITLLLYLPWLPPFYQQLMQGTNIDQTLPGWRHVLSLDTFKALPVILFKLIAGRISLLNKAIYAIYIGFVFFVTFASSFMSRKNLRFVLIWAFAPIFIMLLFSLWLPQNQPFRVIYVLPAFLLMFTYSIYRFPKLFLTLIIYIFIFGNLMYFTRPRLQREQWRPASQFLLSQLAPVIVKFPASFAPLQWYAPNLQIIAAVPHFPSTYNPTYQLVSTSVRGFSKVYLLQYLTDLTDPELNVEKSLQSMNYSLTKIDNFEGVGFIYEYIKINP